MENKNEQPPRKAYYVERITRGVTTVRVYADNAKDAKRRCLDGEYDPLDAEHEGRGFGRVTRAPEEDRSVTPQEERARARY